MKYCSICLKEIKDKLLIEMTYNIKEILKINDDLIACSEKCADAVRHLRLSDDN